MKATDSIHARIAELGNIRDNYIGYLKYRTSEADWHGSWDASVNISETECEIAGLKFALDAIAAEAPGETLPDPRDKWHQGLPAGLQLGALTTDGYHVVLIDKQQRIFKTAKPGSVIGEATFKFEEWDKAKAP